MYRIRLTLYATGRRGGTRTARWRDLRTDRLVDDDAPADFASYDGAGAALVALGFRPLATRGHWRMGGHPYHLAHDEYARPEARIIRVRVRPAPTPDPAP